MTDPAETFRAIAGRHARCFWLDRVHARGWPGLGPVLGWLADDDVSLSLDAAAGLVTRHASGRSDVVGTDVFSVLEEEIAAGPDDALWVGYLGYASRPDLPARPGAGQPDAVWLRVHPSRLVAPEPDDEDRAASALVAKEPDGAHWSTRPGTPGRSTQSRSTCTPAAATRSTSPIGSRRPLRPTP